MTDLDPLFEHLRDAPVPEGLARIEPRVVAGVARRRERNASYRGLALVSAISLVVGISSNLFPASEARASSLFGVPDAAPSHLLAR